jgi:hypothetical protein
MEQQEDDYIKGDLESMYQHYLKTMKLDEHVMSPTQRIERKRTWYIGFSMGMLSILTDSPENQEGFDDAVRSMMRQVKSYLEQSVVEVDELTKPNTH